jgi:hypothetical protein
MNYLPLKVAVHLMSPIILDRNQPLDGILGALIIVQPDARQRDRENRRWLRAVRKYGYANSVEYFEARGWHIPDGPAHFVPLGTWGHGQAHGLWVYCASWAMPAGEVEIATTHFNKKIDGLLFSDWVEGDFKVDPAKGRTKAEHIPFLYSVCDVLEWHCYGLKEEITRLLDFAESIGKKRMRGFGNVREWTVEVEESNRSVWNGDMLMRPVPIELLSQVGITGVFEKRFTTYRPPYWDGRYVAQCAVCGRRTR